MKVTKLKTGEKGAVADKPKKSSVSKMATLKTPRSRPGSGRPASAQKKVGAGGGGQRIGAKRSQRRISIVDESEKQKVRNLYFKHYQNHSKKYDFDTTTHAVEKPCVEDRKETFVDWQANYQGDIQAWMYPSLQEVVEDKKMIKDLIVDGAVCDQTFSLSWKQRIDVEIVKEDADTLRRLHLNERLNLGEKCLRIDNSRKDGVRKAKIKDGDDVSYYAHGMHTATSDVYSDLKGLKEGNRVLKAVSKYQGMDVSRRKKFLANSFVDDSAISDKGSKVERQIKPALKYYQHIAAKEKGQAKQKSLKQEKNTLQFVKMLGGDKGRKFSFEAIPDDVDLVTTRQEETLDEYVNMHASRIQRFFHEVRHVSRDRRHPMSSVVQVGGGGSPHRRPATDVLERQWQRQQRFSPKKIPRNIGELIGESGRAQTVGVAKGTAVGSMKTTPGGGAGAGGEEGEGGSFTHKAFSYLAEMRKAPVSTSRRYLEHCQQQRLVPESTLLRHSAERAKWQRKPDDSFSLAHFGLGNAKGKALALSLPQLPNVATLDFSDNRLSDSGCEHVLHALRGRKELTSLKFSRNMPGVRGFTELCDLLREGRLTELDLSSSQISDADAEQLSLATDNVALPLTSLNLSDNNIGEKGGAALGNMLRTSRKRNPLRLTVVDFSWNTLCGSAALSIGAALDDSACSAINLSYNRLGDSVQMIADGLCRNKKLTDINLTSNGITGKGGMAVGFMLHKNETLKKITLDRNPLGEAGGRAIFRACASGLNTAKLSIHGCSFVGGASLFDPSLPSLGNPYMLDLAEPYTTVVLSALKDIVKRQPGSKFEAAQYFAELEPDSRPKADGEDGGSGTVPGSATRYSSNGLPMGQFDGFPGSREFVDRKGLVRFRFTNKRTIAKEENCICEEGLNDVLQLLNSTNIEVEKLRWLALAMRDAYLLPAQAQGIIDEVGPKVEEKTPGIKHHKTGLRACDVVALVLPRCNLTDFQQETLDSTDDALLHVARNAEKLKRTGTGSVFDLVHNNCGSPVEMSELITNIGSVPYRFNVHNPSGRWSLELQNESHQIVALCFLAIDTAQKRVSKQQQKSRARGDTSQAGNYSNFRNASYNSQKFTDATPLDSTFFENLPKEGVLKFDYVSTNRAQMDGVHTTDTRSIAGMMQSIGVEHALRAAEIDDAGFTTEKLRLGQGDIVTQQKHGSGAMLLHLHLLASHFWFTCFQTLVIFEKMLPLVCNPVEVVISLYGRIVDLENFDVILNEIPNRFHQEIFMRIGYLNILNPLKCFYDFYEVRVYPHCAALCRIVTLGFSPSASSLCAPPPLHSPQLDLQYNDHWVLMKMMLDLSADTGDMLTERSDGVSSSSIPDLYAKKANLPRDVVMHFSFRCNMAIEETEKTKEARFKVSKPYLKQVLLGSIPRREALSKLPKPFEELLLVSHPQHIHRTVFARPAPTCALMHTFVPTLQHPDVLF
jgi:hypothetical protein